MNKILFSALFLGSLAAFTSCDKSEDIQQDHIEIIDGKTYRELEVNFTGIVQNESINFKSSPIKNADHSLGDGSFATTALENSTFPILQKDKPFFKSFPITQPGEYPKNVKKLEEGTLVMLLIFDDKGNHISSKLCTIGDKNTIKVPIPAGTAGLTDFRSVAISFNTKNKDDFKFMDENIRYTSTNFPKIHTPVDKELLYHSAGFGVNGVDPSNTNPEQPAGIQVVLYPQTARIGITVDARGMFGKVTKVVGQITELAYQKVADFDILHQEFVNIKDTITTKIIDFTGSVDTLAYYTYTAVDPAKNTLPSLKAELSNITVETANRTKKVLVDAARTFTFGSNHTLTGQSQINGRINLIEGFNDGVNTWAYANLYYDQTAPTGFRYKFRANPWDGFKLAETDYWVYNRILPNTAALSGSIDGKLVDISGDPCTLVYPHGTWTLPTKGNYDDLFSTTGSANSNKTKTRKNIDPTNGIEYTNVNLNGKDLKFFTLGNIGGSITEINQGQYQIVKQVGYDYYSVVGTGEYAIAGGDGVARSIRCIKK